MIEVLLMLLAPDPIDDLSCFTRGFNASYMNQYVIGFCENPVFGGLVSISCSTDVLWPDSENDWNDTEVNGEIVREVICALPPLTNMLPEFRPPMFNSSFECNPADQPAGVECNDF